MGQVSSVSYPAKIACISVSSCDSAFLFPFLIVEDDSVDGIEFSCTWFMPLVPSVPDE